MPKTVETKLDLWKNRLIDRSKRNNMINFQPTKPTIHVIDELPTEIFKKVIKNHTFRTLIVYRSKLQHGPPESHELKEQLL